MQETIFLKNTLMKRKKEKKKNRHRFTGYFLKQSAAQRHRVPWSLCRAVCAAEGAQRRLSANSQSRPRLTSTAHQRLRSPWANTGPLSRFESGCQEFSVWTLPNILNNDVKSQENRSTEIAIQCIFKIHRYYFLKIADLISVFYRIENNLNHNNLISEMRI